MAVKIAHKLNVFRQGCLRKLFHISCLDHITNEEVLKRAGSTTLQHILSERRFRSAGHTGQLHFLTLLSLSHALSQSSSKHLLKPKSEVISLSESLTCKSMV